MFIGLIYCLSWPCWGYGIAKIAVQPMVMIPMPKTNEAGDPWNPILVSQFTIGWALDIPMKKAIKNLVNDLKPSKDI